MDSTAVDGPSSGPTTAATPAIACALTATTTKSCGPSSAASSEAASGMTVFSPADPTTRRPPSLIADSVAPRASTDTSATAASREARTPPIAPAPTTQMRIVSCLSSPDPCAKVGA